MNRLELIKRNTEEVVGDLSKAGKTVYCGYETSGEIHLGHLVTIFKLMDLKKAGFKIKVLFADWHTWLNQKGDWDFVKKQLKLWEKGFKATGLKAEFVLGSSFQRKVNYIDDVFGMSLKVTINRALRSMQTIARDIEHAKVSQVVYPFMQLADMKYLKVDCAVSGIDQRKIHMLGVDGMFKEMKYKTPIFIHMPIISSLKGPGNKMSSSDATSFISIRDKKEDITRKIKKAHCPEGIIKDNPILQIVKLIIFPKLEKIKIKRDKKFGGDIIYNNYSNLEKDFVNKKLHPMDLKNTVAENLENILKPIRKAFGL